MADASRQKETSSEYGAEERTHTVTLIAGDGIGPEVTAAVVRILEAAVEGTGAKFAWEPFPGGRRRL